DRWEPVFQRELACSPTARTGEGVAQSEDPIGSALDDRLERPVDLTDRVDLYRENFHFQQSSGGLRVSHLNREDRIARLPQRPNAQDTRDDLFQQLEPLPGHLADESGAPRDVSPGSGETVPESCSHRITYAHH